MLTPPAPLPDALCAQALLTLRQRVPLVHCLTNEVVQNFTANVLLALGAAPAMVVQADEAHQFAALADALLINIGTLYDARADSMLAAIASANQAGTPWVLDPVAVGVLSYRSDFARQLLRLGPAAIRGNASEILALAGFPSSGRGVDSQDDALAALPAAQALARQSGAIVALSGQYDYVTDGVRSYQIAGGDALMTRVVGTGCALSAVVAAFVVQTDRLTAVASACRVMALAGQRAAAQASGPGSFTPHFLDALYGFQRAASLEETR
ncbi:hydroxyethylthiazole kinase [Edwardsiella hoshinae]|uniref:Hydroxyethylthiazole kinase n=1 Tax=Edwardsiella hoshinae TaxID=93378 RepID=A0A376DIE3_9GAMM|nr:hydroxyethylthiazole kinase [Edwardsiella hoshinae]AOV97519.1 hydroxyethylthiazole kinase [Edwardsiella hoshinae]QPR29584.1 hydroxyethylthiazole kinase [Edwardsiella hoshinae]STC90006.1 Hydroxyethylthiazole kinase [Edwardsiella hoshinae]